MNLACEGSTFLKNSFLNNLSPREQGGKCITVDSEMKNILLFSYGNQVEYRRAIYTALSFLAWTGGTQDDARLVIYTDDPAFFKKYLFDFSIHYVLLTAERLKEMLGETDFIHRRKICVLQDAYAAFPEDDIFFLDSDTFFTAVPSALLDQVQPNSSIMQIREYALERAPKIYRDLMSFRLRNAESYPISFLRFIGGNTFAIGGRSLTFNKEQYVWNSGVLGIHNSLLPLLDEMLSFADQVYSETKWFISEQLAFGLVLQSFSELKPAGTVINHYFQCKDVADVFINKALAGEFLMLSAPEKLARIRTSTEIIDKLTRLDLYVSISGGAFKRKKYKKGFKFAVRAFKNIALDPWTLDYFKSKFFIEKQKKKKA